jgi:hypothetical protein
MNLKANEYLFSFYLVGAGVILAFVLGKVLYF